MSTGKSGDSELVEALTPLIFVGLIGLAVWVKRAAIIAWLLAHNLLTLDTPVLIIYHGAGLDIQRIALLIIPAVISLITGIVLAGAVIKAMNASDKAT